MKPPLPEQIAKLPKWAQNYVKSLERERDDARRTEKKYRDMQTPSAFFEEYQGPKHQEVRYIQAINLCCVWRGVRLLISAHDFGNAGHGINLQWEDADRHGKDVAFIPQSFQSARLVSKAEMD